MTSVEFKRKWCRFAGKESAAYQEHFNDLCRLLGQPTPAEADPTGDDFFCFQKRVVKDLELFEAQGCPDEGDPAERGFADVWKRGCFAWEYKGKKKDLEAAYKAVDEQAAQADLNWATRAVRCWINPTSSRQRIRSSAVSGSSGLRHRQA